MSAETEHRPLLGRLAEFGWFSRHGEVAATQGLAMVLEVGGLRQALLADLGERTGVDVGDVVSFVPELIHDDLGRPDLEGHDDGGRPRVVVEAKFGAALSSAQVGAYLRDQESRLQDASGILVLLVPSYRVPEASELLDAFKRQRRLDLAPSVITTSVETWEAWLDVLRVAAQELPEKREALLSDLDQLRGLCSTMHAIDIPPLGPVAKGGDPDDRMDDLRRLVAEATARYKPPAGRLIPIGEEPHFRYYRRYVPGGLAAEPECYCSVGVINRLPDDEETPFWLRYHRDTAGFREVSGRIMASPLAAEARGNEGHIWLPLRLSADRSGAALLEELCDQIDEIRAVAAGAAGIADDVP